MARVQKTIKVDNLRMKINNYLRDTEDRMDKERQGLSVILEDVLMETGNYSGFMYLDHINMRKSKNGTTVGMHTDKKGHVLDVYEDRFKNTDKTRVFYY